MENVTRVGIDLAKRVFHVTGVDAAGAVLERRRLRRAQLQSYVARLPRGCVVAMESCGGAHHWARLAQWHGHEALLLSPQFVKPYVKSNKNDVADADAIAEASSRPTMRFVAVKSVKQEHMQQVHHICGVPFQMRARPTSERPPLLPSGVAVKYSQLDETGTHHGAR